MSLKSRNAVITGSTSGIGLAYARALAAEGVNICINGFGDAGAIEAERAGIEMEFGVTCIYNGADMMSGDTSLTTVTIPNNFSEMDIAKDATPNKILVALSALVMQIGGNGVGVSQFIANFQLDLVDDGLIQRVEQNLFRHNVRRFV